MTKSFNIFDVSGPAYHTLSEQELFELIETIREGIKFLEFLSIVDQSPFTLAEWATFLHLSDRTMQRYAKERKTFDANSSEKILEIFLLYKYGVQVFGAMEKFDFWLESKNLALGGAKPKDLLDNSFGISLLKDEIFRIEQGLLA